MPSRGGLETAELPVQDGHDAHDTASTGLFDAPGCCYSSPGMTSWLANYAFLELLCVSDGLAL